MGKHFYIHIPFCLNKCPYCSFYSVKPDSFAAINDYTAAVIKEIEICAADTGFVGGYSEDEDTDTVYIGGGTPSVLPPEGAVKILKKLGECFKLDLDNPSKTEITIEVNPFTADYGKLKLLREGGFNRISIGVQSLDNEVLKTLGRLHDSQKALDTVQAAQKAGFENVSADLIIGVPGETIAGVIKDTETLVNLGVKHISTYSLSIEEGTPFAKRYKNLDRFISQEDERAMYHGLRAFLATKGFIDYEISNSSLPGYESRHNSCYWRAVEYFAFGAGAHGYVNSVRFSHSENYKDYTEKLLTSGSLAMASYINTEEVLDDYEKMKEYMMLAFRTKEGVKLDYFKRRFNKDAETLFSEEIQRLFSRELIVKDGGALHCTKKGLNFANIIFEEFV
ncbi:MAG: radical SAM family heme chaperone HemW [Clostridia bacterium]|nr:radical SAM family heme chaperone HemW [Clostridia bacterium]